MAITHILYLHGGSPFSASQREATAAPRAPNTNVRGEEFDQPTVDAVWEKAVKEFGFYFYRRDLCGTVIAKHEYGKRTRYGWVIDHIVPVSEGGTDSLDNLQPLHWENNVSKDAGRKNRISLVKE